MRCIPISAANRTFATGGRGFVGIVAMVVATAAVSAEPLPGTKPLTLEGDIAAHLLDGAHKFVDREIERSVERRQQHWKRDFSSPEAYDQSVQPNRDRLARMLGINPASNLHANSLPLHEFVGLQQEDSLLLNTDTRKRVFLLRRAIDFDLSSQLNPFFVCWPVAEGLFGRGIQMFHRKLPRPVPVDGTPMGPKRSITVIMLPDSGSSPEEFARISNVRNWETKFLSRLSHLDSSDPQDVDIIEVFVVQMLGHRPLDLGTWKGLRERPMSHREFIYRQAFESGKCVTGCDVQSVLSLINCRKNPSTKIILHGQGDSAFTALAAAAISKSVDLVSVSGDFRSRNTIWQQPIDRNVFGLLTEFGDAEIASLVAPRPIILCDDDRAVVPSNDPLPGATPGVKRAATSEEFDSEVKRLRTLVPPKSIVVKVSMRGLSPYYAEQKWHDTLCAAMDSYASAMVTKNDHINAVNDAQIENALLELIKMRQTRQVSGWTHHAQSLIRESEYVRRDFMKDADRKSRDPSKWHASVEKYRNYFYDEVIGRFEHDLKPFNAQTRQVYDTDTYRGYEVTLDVFDDVIAYGVLLVPKDIKPGEQRPVVVCQHGLEGRPQDTIEKDIPGERYYHQFAAKLAERGFVTFAPQNLYIFKDRFRELQRKLNPLKKTLFSLIVPQHEQICRWLKSQPFVDGSRIGFYGLSYGGKTAMRVPPLVDHYSCVICSGDFNDWIRKCTSIRDPFSYVGTGEYEIWEWNLANTFNYAEMAGLICPRPFMVERGHRDGVGIDEWVDYEYAKVRLLYVDLKIPERTEIEHFDGPHEINGVGSYKFLHKHLNWPEPK